MGDSEPAEPAATRSLPIRAERDLLTARHAVRAASLEAGFGLIAQTKLITAASELVRNCYVHGGGGSLLIEHLIPPPRAGLRLTISDEGPGIPNPDVALTDGYTTGRGLGHGLGGAKRLVDEFHLESAPGRGTTVVITRWT
ncbi:anti-sigma regulatory factor [Nonomuraea wenchangensis]|uniref:Serine/threonine-protein kinase RsbT n=1 Tax=Nonomuraea wenchangensis TaxID=568860 RepID=A0A1I0LP15_9ACTN|nr:anti-sigma regulatory factor [Nonomuraea wenchangensis]SEU43227.1 serine/threonine-protein kinase RsbT [Nonomuraea wenchangensis]